MLLMCKCAWQILRSLGKRNLWLRRRLRLRRRCRRSEWVQSEEDDTGEVGVLALVGVWTNVFGGTLVFMLRGAGRSLQCASSVSCIGIRSDRVSSSAHGIKLSSF